MFDSAINANDFYLLFYLYYVMWIASLQNRMMALIWGVPYLPLAQGSVPQPLSPSPANPTTPTTPTTDCPTATTAGGFERALEKAGQEYVAIIKSWENQWDIFFSPLQLNSPSSPGATLPPNTYNELYRGLSFFGQAVAIITLLFFMVQWFKDMNEGNFARPISELLLPLLVAFLLVPAFTIFINVGGGGANASASYNNMATVIKGLRAEYIKWERAIYTGTPIVGPEPISAVYPRANAMVNTQSIIQEFVAQCQATDPLKRVGEPDAQGEQQGQQSSTQQCNCINIELERSQNLINAYRKEYGGAASSLVWYEQRFRELQKGRDLAVSQRAIDREELQTILAPGGELAWTRKTPGRSDNQSFLLSVQLGFRHTLETALLFTALLGPLAVGASLLPVPAANKAFVAWISGLAAVGSAKLFYYIILGITSQVLLNMTAPPLDLGWFAIFMNTIAPLLALGLATGGGTALFGSLNNFIIFAR